LETDPTRALAWMIGLPAVRYLFGTVSQVKDRPCGVTVDLPLYDRVSRRVWHKRGFTCADGDCAQKAVLLWW
jgi:hypothetical protein